LVKILVFTYVMVRTCQTWKEFTVLLSLVVAGCGYFGWDAFTSFDGTRIEGVGGPDCDNSNQVAFLLLLALPIACVWILRREWWLRVLGLGGGMLILNAVILTRSRGALLGMLAMLILAIVAAPRGYRLLGTAVALALLGAFVSLSDSQFWERMETIKDYESEASAYSRLVIWRGIAKATMDYPLGVGGGNYVLISLQYNPELGKVRVPHNTFLQAAVEFGVQGLAVFGMLLGKTLLLLRSISVRSCSREMKLASLALLVGYCGALVTCVFSDRLFGDAMYWVMGWACIMQGIVETQEALADQPAYSPAAVPLSSSKAMPVPG
jgi:O-antigen ligase